MTSPEQNSQQQKPSERFKQQVEKSLDQRIGDLEVLDAKGAEILSHLKDNLLNFFRPEGNLADLRIDRPELEGIYKELLENKETRKLLEDSSVSDLDQFLNFIGFSELSSNTLGLEKGPTVLLGDGNILLDNGGKGVYFMTDKVEVLDNTIDSNGNIKVKITHDRGKFRGKLKGQTQIHIGYIPRSDIGGNVTKAISEESAPVTPSLESKAPEVKAPESKAPESKAPQLKETTWSGNNGSTCTGIRDAETGELIKGKKVSANGSITWQGTFDSKSGHLTQGFVQTNSGFRMEGQFSSTSGKVIDGEFTLENGTKLKFTGDQKFATTLASYQMELIHSLIELSKEEKEEFAKLAAKELKKNPQTFEGYIDWLDHLYMVCDLDPSRKEALADQVPIKNNQIFELLDQNNKDLRENTKFERIIRNPLFKTYNRIDAVIKVIDRQVTPEGTAQCMEKLKEIQKASNENQDSQVMPLLDDFMKYYEEVSVYEREDRYKDFTALIKQWESNGKYPHIRNNLKNIGSQIVIQLQDSDKMEVDFDEQEGKQFFTFRLLTNRDIFFTILVDKSKDVLQLIDEDPKMLTQLAAKAKEDYAKENGAEQKSIYENYDLPKDKKISSLSVFPKKYNEITAGALHTANLLNSTLVDRYPGIQIEDPLLTDDPKIDLINRVEDSYDNGKGSTHFVLDLYSHGLPEGIGFGKILKPKDILDIVQKFPKCSFTINTIACYGGGLLSQIPDMAEFKNDPELQKRLAIFVQTKPEIPNMGVGIFASLYSLHLIKGLKEGLSYGSAARKADMEVKKTYPLDAESLIDGKKLVENENKSSEVLV